jgi:dipeptidyl aminopeptidase/acylaminoacyl peptidase
MKNSSIRWDVLALAFLCLVVIAALLIWARSSGLQETEDLPDIVLEEAVLGSPEEGYYPLLLKTDRGDIEGQYYPAEDSRYGTILVGGAEAGWGEAAGGVYQRLCETLPAEGIACLRLRYRNSDDPLESILDVTAGIRYLESEGVNSIALVGHSYGGMIVLYTASGEPAVRTVVTLATEGVEEEIVSRLGPRVSLLLLHGRGDVVVSYEISEYLYGKARQPKRLVIYENADHTLDHVAEEVYDEIRDWLQERLREAVE